MANTNWYAVTWQVFSMEVVTSVYLSAGKCANPAIICQLNKGFALETNDLLPSKLFCFEDCMCRIEKGMSHLLPNFILITYKVGWISHVWLDNQLKLDCMESDSLPATFLSSQKLSLLTHAGVTCSVASGHFFPISSSFVSKEGFVLFKSNK